MIALVTGSAGFVGREVVRALRSQGVDVRCLVHTPGREQAFLGQQVEIHYGSVGDPASLRAALYDVQAVVHLVAVIRERGGASFQEINKKGTENVVRAAVDAGVGHLIHISALGALDNPDYPYLFSKWQGEQAVIASGIPYTIIRPSIVFGPGDEFVTVLAGLVRAFPLVPVAGSGRVRLQPIAAEDLSRCAAESVGRDDLKGKVLEIGGPQQLSYNEIVDVIVGTYGVTRVKVHVPLPVVLLMARVMGALLPESPATPEQLRMLSISNVAGLDTVHEVFGFTPRPLAGNIDYVKDIGFADGLRIALGSMPRRLRDH